MTLSMPPLHESRKRLALGTAQFGLDYGIANQQGQVPDDAARAIVDHASAHGIDTLDTAIAYGDSEKRLGEIGVRNWRVVSKLPAADEGCADLLRWVQDSVDTSLERLNVTRLYGLLLHRPHQLLEPGGDRLFAALQQLKCRGVVEKVGVSIYDPAELDLICERYPLDMVQAPFNIMDSRLIESGWLSRLSEQGTELHVRSAFLQGLLLMEAGTRPEKFGRWEKKWRCWDEWLRESELTPLQACIGYVLGFPQIDRVVIGVDSLAQLTEILHSLGAPPSGIPSELFACDPVLVNPSRWSELG